MVSAYRDERHDVSQWNLVHRAHSFLYPDYGFRKVLHHLRLPRRRSHWDPREPHRRLRAIHPQRSIHRPRHHLHRQMGTSPHAPHWYSSHGILAIPRRRSSRPLRRLGHSRWFSCVVYQRPSSRRRYRRPSSRHRSNLNGRPERVAGSPPRAPDPQRLHTPAEPVRLEQHDRRATPGGPTGDVTDVDHIV